MDAKNFQNAILRAGEGQMVQLPIATTDPQDAGFFPLDIDLENEGIIYQKNPGDLAMLLHANGQGTTGVWSSVPGLSQRFNDALRRSKLDGSAQAPATDVSSPDSQGYRLENGIWQSGHGDVITNDPSQQLHFHASGAVAGKTPVMNLSSSMSITWSELIAEVASQITGSGLVSLEIIAPPALAPSQDQSAQKGMWGTWWLKQGDVWFAAKPLGTDRWRIQRYHVPPHVDLVRHMRYDRPLGWIGVLAALGGVLGSAAAMWRGTSALHPASAGIGAGVLLGFASTPSRALRVHLAHLRSKWRA